MTNLLAALAVSLSAVSAGAAWGRRDKDAKHPAQLSVQSFFMAWLIALCCLWLYTAAGETTARWLGCATLATAGILMLSEKHYPISEVCLCATALSFYGLDILMGAFCLAVAQLIFSLIGALLQKKYKSLSGTALRITAGFLLVCLAIANWPTWRDMLT